MTSPLSSLRSALRTDFTSSLVVFLVALPLCVGVAVASGVPGALGMIPTAALAGVLIHAGFKLLPVKELGPLWREHRGEAVVLVITAGRSWSPTCSRAC
ncbi:hypothetical protein [Streptomyces flaveus]|uniref:Uncharacterized protein n=1 Tax=Streptomyces flaveus TaxID=66370 RepID=A0A917QZ74_9ACTN|nr:hypothetical protein [Streptomyces flaveus]GGK76828.1 hypothetical protein GCM10010094_42530 [Streptomyces flaveus]